MLALYDLLKTGTLITGSRQKYHTGTIQVIIFGINLDLDHFEGRQAIVKPGELCY